MHLATRVFLLRMLDKLVHVALHRPIAAGRVCVETTACLHRDVGRLLHRLDREISSRLDDHSALAAHPGDDRWPVFVIMPSAGLALLAATPRSAAQRLLPSMFGLSLLPGGVIEVIGFHDPFQLTLLLVGEGSIAQPPAPPIACADMDAQLSGNTPRRTRQTQQEGGQNPVGERPLALVKQRLRQIVERPPTGFATVAFETWSIMVRAP